MSETLAVLFLQDKRRTITDNYVASKGLLEDIRLLSLITDVQDRDSEAKYGILLNTVFIKLSYLHTERNPSLPYKLLAVINASNSSIRARTVHHNQRSQ